jgi:hypothetical protein
MSEQRTPHGNLVSIWRRLAAASKRGGSRPRLDAYLASPGFLANLAALDPVRRVLALEAVGEAIARVGPAPVAHVATRIRWTPEWQARVRDAARRLPDDRAIARELGLSTNVARMARWRYVGPRHDKPHVARIAA